MGLIDSLVKMRRLRLAREVGLLISGVDIPASVRIGERFILQHRGQGVVINPHTVIGDDVVIFQQVTIGRAAVDGSDEEVGFEGIQISDGAVICAGARVLGGRGTLVVGEHTIIAANAVLTQSTGPREIWAGVPARQVGIRADG